MKGKERIMEEEKKTKTSEDYLALARKVEELLLKESGGDSEMMVFAIRTAASLIFHTDYQSRIKL